MHSDYRQCALPGRNSRASENGASTQHRKNLSLPSSLPPVFNEGLFPIIPPGQEHPGNSVPEEQPENSPVFQRRVLVILLAGEVSVNLFAIAC